MGSCFFFHKICNLSCALWDETEYSIIIHSMKNLNNVNRPHKTFIIQHYENMPIQYTRIFHVCKNHNFQMKICDIFLIFALNVDCGYTLEPPQCGGSNEYLQSMF